MQRWVPSALGTQPLTSQSRAIPAVKRPAELCTLEVPLEDPPRVVKQQVVPRPAALRPVARPLVVATKEVAVEPEKAVPEPAVLALADLAALRSLATQQQVPVAQVATLAMEATVFQGMRSDTMAPMLKQKSRPHQAMET